MNTNVNVRELVLFPFIPPERKVVTAERRPLADPVTEAIDDVITSNLCGIIYYLKPS